MFSMTCTPSNPKAQRFGIPQVKWSGRTVAPSVRTHLSLMMRMTTMITMAQPESWHDGHRFWSFGVLCGFWKNATFGRNMCQKFKGCDVDLCSMSCLAILARWNLFGHQLASRAKKFTHLDSSFSSQRRYSWQVHHYEMSLQAFWTSTIPTCPGLKATWDWVWAIPELVSWRIT